MVHEHAFECLDRSYFQVDFVFDGEQQVCKNCHTPLAQQQPDRVRFERVIEIDQKPEIHQQSGSANYAQCMALACLVTEDQDSARDWLDTARQRITNRSEPEMSCWRYRSVDSETFIKDLDEMKKALNGGPVVPAFLSQAKVLPSA